MTTTKRGNDDDTNLLDRLDCGEPVCGGAAVLPDGNEASPIRWGREQRDLTRQDMTLMTVVAGIGLALWLGCAVCMGLGDTPLDHAPANGGAIERLSHRQARCQWGARQSGGVV